MQLAPVREHLPDRDGRLRPGAYYRFRRDGNSAVLHTLHGKFELNANEKRIFSDLLQGASVATIDIADPQERSEAEQFFEQLHDIGILELIK